MTSPIQFLTDVRPGRHCHLDTRQDDCYCWPDEVWDFNTWHRWFKSVVVKERN